MREISPTIVAKIGKKGCEGCRAFSNAIPIIIFL